MSHLTRVLDWLPDVRMEVHWDGVGVTRPPQQQGSCTQIAPTVAATGEPPPSSEAVAAAYHPG